MSALPKADIHLSLTHTHTGTYNSFMSIFAGAGCIRKGSGATQVQDQVRCLPPVVSSLSARLSPTSPPLCQSTSTDAYSLRIHFLIGAAARRCCCAQSAADAGAEQNTPKKGMVYQGPRRYNRRSREEIGIYSSSIAAGYRI